MGRKGNRFFWFVIMLLLLAGAYWKYAIPIHRVEETSELIMLGDLDGDGRWTSKDQAALAQLTVKPFGKEWSVAWRADMDQDGALTKDDTAILNALVQNGSDPYLAETRAFEQGRSFPRPRELYRYRQKRLYHPRLAFASAWAFSSDPELLWFKGIKRPPFGSDYQARLDADVYSEAVRFDVAWRSRRESLLPLEKDYARLKLARARGFLGARKTFDLLLALISLTEDAETLTQKGQPSGILQLLVFRDHLRETLHSAPFKDLEKGSGTVQPILEALSKVLKADTGLDLDLVHAAPPRDLKDLGNYAQRTVWQYHKTSSKGSDFRALVAFAQMDPRYLRAVADTSRPHQDSEVQNHSLAMSLLYREALRIKAGDKKAAAGLLDEAIRIPYAWIKSLPRERLPSSVALENFLLPGNKEDGNDKSRHWNVFGALCLYKSQSAALELALRRELKDLREEGGTAPAMTEFIRDMIANLNGMYTVQALDQNLLEKTAAEAL